jgi:ArsR family transcriptional regulator
MQALLRLLCAAPRRPPRDQGAGVVFALAVEEQMQALTTTERLSPTTPDGSRVPELGPVAGLAALDAEFAGELVKLFKLMADETRLRILNYLMQTHELNVRTLCGLLGQSQPAVSHHLALLKEAGLIECRRDGKHNFYRIAPQRCAEHLDRVFGVNGAQTRKLRLDDAVLTYGRDGQAALA